VDKRPIIAGIFKGEEKPSNPFQFFEYFVQEVIDTQEQCKKNSTYTVGLYLNDFV